MLIRVYETDKATNEVGVRFDEELKFAPMDNFLDREGHMQTFKVLRSMYGYCGCSEEMFAQFPLLMSEEV